MFLITVPPETIRTLGGVNRKGRTRAVPTRGMRQNCVIHKNKTVRFTKTKTHAVHEQKPRYKFYLSQMDEMLTQ